MDISEYVDLCLVRRGRMSHAELARRTGQLPQGIFVKFKNGTFKLTELEKIAEALDCTLSVRFLDKKSGEPLV